MILLTAPVERPTGEPRPCVCARCTAKRADSLTRYCTDAHCPDWRPGNGGTQHLHLTRAGAQLTAF